MLEYLLVQCVPTNGTERACAGGLHREQIPSKPCAAPGDEAIEYTKTEASEGQRARRSIHVIQGPATRCQEESGPVLSDHLQILRR